MSSIEGKTVGVTFYCPTQENFVKVSRLAQALNDGGIMTMWTTLEWDGTKVTALNVYEHANVVVDYLKVM